MKREGTGFGYIVLREEGAAGGKQAGAHTLRCSQICSPPHREDVFRLGVCSLICAAIFIYPTTFPHFSFANKCPELVSGSHVCCLADELHLFQVSHFCHIPLSQVKLQKDCVSQNC